MSKGNNDTKKKSDKTAPSRTAKEKKVDKATKKNDKNNDGKIDMAKSGVS